MSVYDHRCSDCQVCPECGRTAWCENDRILIVPCEHKGLCGDCNLEGCQDCRLDAEAHMYHSGDYDPRVDPFFDHTAPEPVDRIARDGGYHWDGGWVDMPKEEGA